MHAATGKTTLKFLLAEVLIQTIAKKHVSAQIEKEACDVLTNACGGISCVTIH